MSEINVDKNFEADKNVKPVEFKAGDVTVPLGYYYTDHEGTRFRPNVLALLAVCVPLALVASRVIRAWGKAAPRVIRAMKH